MLVKSSDESSTTSYGTAPNERTIEQLLNLGVINLDKPPGPTSHQVASWVKDILEVAKAGHGGTLDPKVTGVLPIALNDATRAIRTLLLGGKEYVGIMRLHGDVAPEKIREICAEFVGEIYQLPPIQSAVKRQLRIRTIYFLEVLEIEKRDVLVKVECQAGTYIRTLASDIGDILGVGGQLLELRRTRAGPFVEKDSVTLHELKDRYVFWQEDGEEDMLRSCILPVEKLLEHLPKLVIKDSAVDAICHGAPLAIPGILQVENSLKRGTKVAIMSAKGEGVAIGEATLTSDEIMGKDNGLAVDIDRVIMAPSTYPMLWKTKSK